MSEGKLTQMGKDEMSKRKWFMMMKLNLRRVVSGFKVVSMRLKTTPKKTIRIGGSIFVLVMILTIVLTESTKKSGFKSDSTSMETTKVTLPENSVGIQLTDISVKLANVEHRLSSQKPVVNLDPIRTEISQLASQTKSLAEKSNEMFSQEIQDSTQELNQQLTVIKNELQKLQQEQHRIRYISANTLPFKVMHIDNIQQNNVVTVEYNHTIFPMELGDYLAGWKLISADFTNQKAEFINDKQQHTLVDINRLMTNPQTSDEL